MALSGPKLSEAVDCGVLVQSFKVLFLNRYFYTLPSEFLDFCSMASVTEIEKSTFCRDVPPCYYSSSSSPKPFFSRIGGQAESTEMKPTTRHGTGQTGEYLVAADLAIHGLNAALPTGNAEAIDVLAYGFGKTLAIQVKTAGRGDHQFNLGKFVSIQFLEDGGQLVLERTEKLDPEILIVFVFLGDKAGEDQFAWTFLGEFADFLAETHGAYLSRNGGRRPGKNAQSLHAALSRKVLQDRFPCKSVVDLLKSESVPRISATHEQEAGENFDGENCSL